MEENNSSSLRVETSKNKDFDDDFKLTALFTAGTAVFAVGLKRATVVFLLKQWQLWIFLVLNLLLLAILFCSTRSRHGICSKEKTKTVAVMGSKRGRKRSIRPNLESAKEEEEEEIVSTDDYSYKLKESESTIHFWDNRECLIGDETVDDVLVLSDEELNERVESFIASFKKQLVLDARKMREV